MFGDLGKMMKQAQELQGKLAAVQEEIALIEATGSAGGGLVSVTLSGKGDLKSLKIDPSILRAEDAEIVEDLIVAAHADAKAKSEALSAERMKSVTGGLGLPPGMKLPF
jgi:DNA-binding YbaB/EbfC family protein